MRRTVSLLLILVLLISMSVSVAAQETEYTFNIEGEVITICGALTESEAYEIAYLHYCIENDIDIFDTYATCSHTYETQVVTATTHRARATAPRCQKFTYKINRCSKCYDTVTTLLRTWYVDCCD